ncbi:MAG TPA: hypothetical protein VFU22_31780 [Roseiflexaceae bacterium]|nr:hypothetical protein [Roseiflexaceae bacterium]
MMVDPSTTQRDTPFSPTGRSLWFSLLGAPSAWLVHFLAIWVIAEWGCLASWSRFTLLGFDAITVLLVLATFLVLPLVIAAGMMAWRIWQRTRANANDGGSEHRSAYMSFGGVVLSTLFAFAIFLESLPALLLHPCG